MKLHEPEKVTIQEIITQIDMGTLGVPSFQRDFSWKRSDMVDLFESIIHGYYIGSLLFWEAKNPDDLSPTSLYSVPKHLNFSPRDIVLDGQQRLSTIYYVIMNTHKTIADEIPSIKFFINIEKLLNLENYDEGVIISVIAKDEIKKSLQFAETQFKLKLFPLSKLPTFYDWLDEYAIFLVKTGDSETIAKEKKKQLREMLQKIWNEYQIPIIRLPSEMTLENVAKVFEKLNSTGRSLTTFDLLNARFTKHKIELRRELLHTAIDEYQNIETYFDATSKLPVLLLQAICLKRGKALKRSAILKLDPINFVQDWESTIKNVNIAIDQLKNLPGNFGAFSYDWNPYPSMLPALAELIPLAEKHKNPDKCMEKITSWYWSICYAGSYDSSSDTKIADDVTAVKTWFDNDTIEPSFMHVLSDVRMLDVEGIISKSNAIFKAITCLIVLNGSRDFVSDELITDMDSFDIHHIFPKKITSGLKSPNDINSILNKTLITKTTNRNYIGAKSPSAYIKKIMYDKQLSLDVLKSRFKLHLISDTAFECLLNDDFYGFIEARKYTIIAEFKKRIISYVEPKQQTNI